MLCEKGRESGPSDYWQSARCSCRMRRERLIRPTRSCKFNILQEACRPDKRSASGSFAFAISLKGRESGPSDYWQSARCSCRMRRERLIRPTRSCKFNILQEACRPDKRSASGSFAFAISLKGRESGPSDYWQSARCSCRMRRERLIRPTRSCKFNILQEVCRPDKRSASGSFAFAISFKGRESGPFFT